jgi:hypothetical protein
MAFLSLPRGESYEWSRPVMVVRGDMEARDARHEQEIQHPSWVCLIYRTLRRKET